MGTMPVATKKQGCPHELLLTLFWGALKKHVHKKNKWAKITHAHTILLLFIVLKIA